MVLRLDSRELSGMGKKPLIVWAIGACKAEIFLERVSGREHDDSLAMGREVVFKR